MLYVTDQHELAFRFPEVHEEAKLTVQLQRTLRVPDDGRDYLLPEGLGCFPVRHVDDYAQRVPSGWLKRGGVVVPVHQSEAISLRFEASHIASQGRYPFAIKIGLGKINALTGRVWNAGLKRGPQEYVVVPEQEWLDGFVVEQGVVRQFVAMPLGKGYTAEEQITGQDTFGGIQIEAYPMKREVFEERFPAIEAVRFSIADTPIDDGSLKQHARRDMGVAPSGRMRQPVAADPYELRDWDLTRSSRCFVHLCNSVQWRSITAERPPNKPIGPKRYREAGLPWFEHYAEPARMLRGGATLADLRSISTHAERVGDNPPAGNQSYLPGWILNLCSRGRGRR